MIKAVLQLYGIVELASTTFSCLCTHYFGLVLKGADRFTSAAHTAQIKVTDEPG